MPNTTFRGRWVRVLPPLLGWGSGVQIPAVMHTSVAICLGKDHGPCCIKNYLYATGEILYWCKDQCHHVHKINLLPWYWLFLVWLLYKDINDLSLDCIFIPLCESMMDNSGIKGLPWKMSLEMHTCMQIMLSFQNIHQLYLFLIYTLYTHHRLNFPILVLLFMLELLTSTESLKKQNSFFWYWT